MPSPFPGMDPYLEASHIWPDFHDSLAAELRAALNRLLPQRYYALREMRPEIGILDADERPKRIVPDVSIVEFDKGGRSAAGVAVLEEPRTEASPFVEVYASVEPTRHHYLEIRDSTRDHRLVTLIEIVSPSNKRPGKDREAYLAKQAEVLASDASLVEIDLLRSGERLFSGEGLVDCIQRHVPTADYVVAVNRVWNREKSRLYLVNIRQPLPVIQVPLREGEPEVLLDLQYIVNQAYDRGPYQRGAVDYRKPPSVALAPEDVDWAAQRLVQHGGER